MTHNHDSLIRRSSKFFLFAEHPLLTPRYHSCQDTPYAFFGTCLGAIIAYEVAQRTTARGLPPPLAFFPAAVSPPHLYAMAVMKLYLAPGAKVDSSSFETVIDKLRNWREIPKETLMLVGFAEA